MKKNILIYGSVMGLIMCLNMVYMVYLCYTEPELKTNDVLGYAAMIVVFSLIFFGVRNYRNRYNDGVITFGKAFKTGAWIALLASTMYVVVWLFSYYLFVPDYLDKYIPHVMKGAERAGVSAAELAKKAKDMAQFKEMYKNPAFVVLTTYAEVLPIALVVALISALILKRKTKRAEAAVNTR